MVVTGDHYTIWVALYEKELLVLTIQIHCMSSEDIAKIWKLSKLQKSSNIFMENSSYDQQESVESNAEKKHPNSSQMTTNLKWVFCKPSAVVLAVCVCCQFFVFSTTAKILHTAF